VQTNLFIHSFIRSVIHSTHPALPQPDRQVLDGMARLSWSGWLVIYRDGSPAHRRSRMQILTWKSNSHSINQSSIIKWPKQQTATSRTIEGRTVRR